MTRETFNGHFVDIQILGPNKIGQDKGAGALVQGPILGLD